MWWSFKVNNILVFGFKFTNQLFTKSALADTFSTNNFNDAFINLECSAYALKGIKIRANF